MSHVTHVCHVTHTRIAYVLGPESCVCVGMTQSYVWHDSFMRASDLHTRQNGNRVSSRVHPSITSLYHYIVWLNQKVFLSLHVWQLFWHMTHSCVPQSYTRDNTAIGCLIKHKLSNNTEVFLSLHLGQPPASDTGVYISHMYEWVTSHLSARESRMNESCHTYEWVMSHIWMSHVTHMNESCHTYESVMSHKWMSHVALVCAWVTYEWVMSHL